MGKKIVFLTGTRADFGKLKSLIEITQSNSNYEVSIFATGMHMHHKYGYTVNEIVKCGFPNIYRFINFTSEETMDLTLAKTIEGFSAFVKENQPDLIIVHGDRVEALAGAIVGALNNILVGHIEGGEVSGTIDELIRHSVSKLSHIHFVSNDQAGRRLIQMGEMESSVYSIGSPDIDIMFSEHLPKIEEVKRYYEIPFSDYAVAMFHPVTTEVKQIRNYAENFSKSLLDSNLNYILIYPNNDLGSSEILSVYDKTMLNSKIRIFPSVRFEYFLVLLKYAKFIIGNSSAGIREAPYYGIPSVNIGTRQNNRSLNTEILNCNYDIFSISSSIQKAINSPKLAYSQHFGAGESDIKFIGILNKESFWAISKQKVFKDI